MPGKRIPMIAPASTPESEWSEWFNASPTYEELDVAFEKTAKRHGGKLNPSDADEMKEFREAIEHEVLVRALLSVMVGGTAKVVHAPDCPARKGGQHRCVAWDCVFQLVPEEKR